MVSKPFYSYISECEFVFSVTFDTRCNERGILSVIVHELMSIPLPVECEQFPKVKFLKYFVRMRIYYKLKFFNRTLTNSKS